MLPQQYCLRWKHYHANVQSMFSHLLERERFCDVTLYCSSADTQSEQDGDSVPNLNADMEKKQGAGAGAGAGVSLRAHRVVLASCSPLLASLLAGHDADGAGGEPVLVVDGAQPHHVKALLQYMYTGEMSIHVSQLGGLLKTAEELSIKGLSDIRWNGHCDKPPDPPDAESQNQFKKKPCSQKTVADASSSVAGKGASPAAPRPHAADASHDPATAGMTPARVNAVASVSSLAGQSDGLTNGGPPGLIKLPAKNCDRRKRISSPSEGDGVTSPKRQRANDQTSGEEEDHDPKDWVPKVNVDYRGGAGCAGASPSWEQEESEPADSDSDAEFPGSPRDLASYLHTNLRVDGELHDAHSADEESSPQPKSPSQLLMDMKPEITVKALLQTSAGPTPTKATTTTSTAAPAKPPPKEGSADKFGDVVKLNDYLQHHGRRPQFWEEDYVRRVMEAVRLKELEMKQAAEILGVSYGTLYGRYRDVYGCINRPYRIKDFWTEQAPAEVLLRLQRGEVSLGAAAEVLGVAPATLAAYLNSLTTMFAEGEKDPMGMLADLEASFDIDPLMAVSKYKGGGGKVHTPPTSYVGASISGPSGLPPPHPFKDIRKYVARTERQQMKKQTLGSSPPQPAEEAEAGRPGAGKGPAPAPTPNKGPMIRVANIESLRAPGHAAGDAPALEPAALLKTRPDLTIVASSARRGADRGGDDSVT